MYPKEIVQTDPKKKKKIIESFDATRPQQFF